MTSRRDTLTGSGLRRIRRRLGFSQAAFAELVHAHPNTVAKWERGELGMRPSTVALIRLLTAEPARSRPVRKGK